MLKPQEIALISLSLWYLPLPQLEQVKELVERLRKEHGYEEPTDDSDEWTEEDFQERREASWKRLEEREELNDAADAEAG
jgi:hypothetical protein